MKKILSIVLVVMFLMASIAGYTETIRQGGDRYSFNSSNIVTKTTAYTLTSSDSLVKFTATSATIVATLPSVASTRAAGTKAYKILKTDATVFAIIVTPASGDTIGGESTRYIMGQNDYIIISPGSDNDWDVAFESPYMKEDYELGTITIAAPITSKAGMGGIKCGSTTTCGATASSIKTVYGYVTLVGGSASVVSIDPAFTATTSYVCTVGSRGATNHVGVGHTSTSSITLTSATTADVSIVDYICVGN